MSKAKKGPAKKAGKKPGKRTPMRPSYAKAKTASRSAKPATSPIQVQVNWLLDQAKAHGWGTP